MFLIIRGPRKKVQIQESHDLSNHGCVIVPRRIPRFPPSSSFFLYVVVDAQNLEVSSLIGGLSNVVSISEGCPMCFQHRKVVQCILKLGGCLMFFDIGGLSNVF